MVLGISVGARDGEVEGAPVGVIVAGLFIGGGV